MLDGIAYSIWVACGWGHEVEWKSICVPEDDVWNIRDKINWFKGMKIMIFNYVVNFVCDFRYFIVFFPFFINSFLVILLLLECCTEQIWREDNKGPEISKYFILMESHFFSGKYMGDCRKCRESETYVKTAFAGNEEEQAQCPEDDAGAGNQVFVKKKPVRVFFILWLVCFFNIYTGVKQTQGSEYVAGAEERVWVKERCRSE